ERWCLEKSTAPDVVLQMIDKGPCRHVAGGAAQRRLMAKWLEKERLATQLGLIRIGWRKPTAWAEPRVAQEINVLDVCHQGIENGRGGLGSGEFVDDGVANEVAQRCKTAVMAVRSKVACASQARNPDRIKQAVEGFRIEGQARGVEISRARGHAR